jgi:hypothetical protein
MDTLETTRAVFAENELLAVISRPGGSLDEVAALAFVLGKCLQEMDQQGRTLILTRLRSKAEEVRASGEITDAVLMELVLHSLQRFVQ